MASVKAAIVMIHTAGGVSSNLASALDSGFAFVETKDLDFGEIDRIKFISRIVYAIKDRAGTNLKLTIRGRDTLEDAIQDLVTLSLASDDDINVRVQGFRYYRLRFEDSAVVRVWKLARFEVLGQLGGARL